MPEDPVEACAWILPQLHSKIAQAGVLVVKLTNIDYMAQLRGWARMLAD